jgi:hypothetical protein
MSSLKWQGEAMMLSAILQRKKQSVAMVYLTTLTVKGRYFNTIGKFDIWYINRYL